MKKKIAIVLCAILCMIIGVLPAFSISLFENADYTSDLRFSSIPSESDVYAVRDSAIATSNFVLLNTTFPNASDSERPIPIAIMLVSYSATEYGLRVIYKNDSSTTVDFGIPEEWGVRRTASFTITASGVTRFMVGEFGFRVYDSGEVTLPRAPVYALTPSSSGSSSYTVSFYSQWQWMQLVYVFPGYATISGVNDTFAFSDTSCFTGAELSALQNYSNAWSTVLDGSSGSVSPEEVESAYNDGYYDGYESGYDDGYETGYGDGSEAGYDEGYYDGYESGVVAGGDGGYGEGYDDGYDFGYTAGQRDGSAFLDIGGIISAIPTAAKGIINNVFGFELFGINVAGFLSALLVVGIIAFVVKWLMSR